MQVKFKKLHPDAVMPSYAKPGDAGMDLTAVTVNSETGRNPDWEYGTGLAVEIPSGYVGLLFPRSSIYKTGFSLANGVGVIDSSYRGELRVRFYDTDAASGDDWRNPYEIGDRIAQLVILPFPKIEPIESDELSETERGTGGYGSTGR